MAARLARSSLVSLLSREREVAHTSRDVDEQRDLGFLAVLVPLVEECRHDLRFGYLEQRLGLEHVDTVLGDERIGQFHLRIAGSEPELEDLLLVLGLLDEFLEEAGRSPLVLVDPLGVEDEERVVAEQRPLAGVDRHQRYARGPSLLAGVEHAVGVAEVVVDHRLLLDGCGRGVGQGRAPLIGRVPVVEERQRRGPVVDNGRLDVLGELDRLGVGDVLLREALGLARGGVALGDERRQAAGGEVGVGLAQAELTPLGSVEGLPPLLAVGQVEDVAPPDVGLGPSERLGHGLRHGDDQGGDHERLTVAHHGWLPGVAEPLVEDRTPRTGRR